MQKVVLITGAATGFGRDTAERLARRGHHVFATMQDIGGANAPHRAELEQIAVAESVSLHVLELDVTNDHSVAAAIDRALAISGRIDVVINNAGLAGIGVAEAYTIEQWKQVFDVNLFGSVRINRAVLPSMRKRRDGLLIHMSSGSGRIAVPSMALYCASKFALEALSDAYRFELSPFGIDSILVEPGIYRTPIFDQLIRPLDRERIADYGALAEVADRVDAMFRTAIAAPETPGADVVAEALVSLIEMDAGKRPSRTLLSPAMEYLLEPYNASYEAMRPAILQLFGLTDLLSRPATS
jgi:NAD(P)-dependent dehydrogenase (short-subunit alcohol dehydrogenase family)